MLAPAVKTQRVLRAVVSDLGVPAPPDEMLPPSEPPPSAFTLGMVFPIVPRLLDPEPEAGSFLWAGLPADLRLASWEQKTRVLTDIMKAPNLEMFLDWGGGLSVE